MSKRKPRAASVWMFIHPKGGAVWFSPSCEHAGEVGGVAPYSDLRRYTNAATSFPTAQRARQALVTAYQYVHSVRERGGSDEWAEKRWAWLSELLLHRVEVAA